MYERNRGRKRNNGSIDDDLNYDSTDRAFNEHVDITTEDIQDDPEMPGPDMFTQPPMGGGMNRPRYDDSQSAVYNFCVSIFMWMCEGCCGFNASLTKQNPFGFAGLYAYAICLGWISLLDGFANIILEIYRLIIRAIKWFWESMILTSYFGVPAILWYIAIFVILFLISTYWQLVLLFVIKYLIPLLNIMILLYNFTVRLFLITYRLLATIWNIFVPFIGMIIFVVVKLVVTILQIVFDILSSDGFMSVIQSLMEVIIALVEIAIGILMKLIQLGMPILKIVAQILPILIEIVFTIVEVVLDIVVWIINLLFKIIAPILEAIGAFFSVFTFSALLASSNKFSRKLFSVATGIDENSLRAIAALGMGAAAITHMQEALLRSGKVNGFGSAMFAARFAASPDAHSDEWRSYAEYAYVLGRQYIDNSPVPNMSEFDSQWENYLTEVNDISSNVNFSNGNDTYVSTGRSPLSYSNSAVQDITGLDIDKLNAVLPQSVEEMRIESSKAKFAERTRNAAGVSARDFGGEMPKVEAPPNTASAPKKGLSTGDRNTQILSESFHNYAYNKMNDGDTQWLDVAHYTLDRINKHNQRGLSSTNPIIYLKKARKAFPALFAEPTVSSSLRYTTVLHPGEVHVNLFGVRKTYVKLNGLEYDTWKEYEATLASRGARGGRALLSVETVGGNVDPIEHSRYLHLRDMEIDHGVQIAQANDKYEDHNLRNIVAIQTIGNAFTQQLRYHAENTVHPDKLAKHVNSAVNAYGYDSVQHAFDEFMKFHLEGGVVKALTVRNWPGISFLAGYGHDEDDEMPTFRGWEKEETKLRDIRAGRRPLAFPSNSERAYAQEENIKANAETRGATASKSTGAFEGLEVLTEGDCFSEDKNPLCLPIPSPDLAEKLQIGQIKLDERITEDSNLCDPWKLETIQSPSWLPGIIRWALTHIYNTGVSFAFIISAFPITNILLTSFMLLFPFLKWSIKWIFIVPPNRFLNFAQGYCFFVNLYSMLITYYIWLFLRYIVFELFLVVLKIFTNLCSKTYAQQRELTSRFLEQQENNPALRRALYEAALFRKVIDREHKREEAATRRQIQMEDYSEDRDIELIHDRDLVQNAVGARVGDMPSHHHRALKLHIHHHPRHFSQEAMMQELRHLSSVLEFSQLSKNDPELMQQLCRYIANVVIGVNWSAEPLRAGSINEIERGRHIEAHVTLQEMFPSLFGLNQTRARLSHNQAASSTSNSPYKEDA